MLSNAGMAREAAPDPVAVSDKPVFAALQHRTFASLATVPQRLELFLAGAGFSRAPWLPVCLGAGIAAWFGLHNRWQWLAVIALGLGVAAAAAAILREDGRYPWLRRAVIVSGVLIAAGCALVWARSEWVGARAIARPMVTTIAGTIFSRDMQVADGRVRLVIDARQANSSAPLRLRVNVPLTQDKPQLQRGAVVSLRARLMPPAPPMLPGSYDFARSAWFSGIAATGSVIGDVTVISLSQRAGGIADVQAALSRHVRERLTGSSGAIAATLVSGDRGAIAEADDAAMRDAGLAHLLSVSGLHLSAVVAGTWFVVMRLFALWPWLALRVRLPLVAAGAGALVGLGYTLLTGAEVPTVRSLIGSLLVLAALALGREPLSMRMIAVAAFVVMLFWPEAVVGPSFQMSFAAVIAIVALHDAAPIRACLAPREEGVLARWGRRLAMLVLTGVVIEIALMPIGLFHFHRAGVYGALANVIAIPLTTFVTMPLCALALFLDIVGLGAPAWWLAGKSLDLLLALAHWTAAQPGAVTLLPTMGRGSFALFLAGSFWLALWRGRVRLWGLVPLTIGSASLALVRPPDLLISSDGRHVGIAGEVPDKLLVIRETRSDYTRTSLAEMAGMSGELVPLAQWPGAQCSRDYCAVEITRSGRSWHLLIARGTDPVEERALAAACEQADIVISPRWLPYSCRPRFLRADRRTLEKTGGLAIDLSDGATASVSQTQGDHGWWRRPEPRRFKSSPKPAGTPDAAATSQ